MPQYCRFCGAKLKNPQARFCSACGKGLGPDTTGHVASKESAVLSIRVPGHAAYEVPLAQNLIDFGRAPDNDLVVSQPYVSAYHGRFERRGDEWYYEDLGSTNGTYVNGRLLNSARLQTGDVLRIGDPHGNNVGLTFRGSLTATGRRAIGTTALGVQTFAGKSSVTIGRDPASTIHLPGAVVSWHHARLDAVSGGHTLVDLNSTNGTFVNGTRVTGNYLLHEGDVIQVGAFRLVYQAQGVHQYAAAGGVRLDGIAVTREVGRGDQTRRILNEISLSVYPREFVALVGTSGAGKSTLMKALSAVARAQEGAVLVNGDSLYDHFDLYRTMIGYVPQDDILHSDLKVHEALTYAAELRLPPDTSTEEIERRIDRVLQEVEMVAQKDQVIRSLSGGQRKRVSIAAELLAEPRLFFLDEPTSGLDPGLEKKMMYLLRRLADAGRTVVLVTHATANITQCDHVCFLTNGRMAYYGPPEETFGFFEVGSGDFADVYDLLDDQDPQVARQAAASWEARYRGSLQYKDYVTDRQQALSAPDAPTGDEAERRGPRVNALQQLGVLTRRYLNLVLRDTLLLTVLLLAMPFVAALVLLVAERNWMVGNSAAEIERQLAADLAAGEQSATYSLVVESQTVLFLMAFASVFLGVYATVYEIVKEWSVYQRERLVGLRIVPYILSKVLVMGGFALLQCLLFLLVIALRVEYPKEGVLVPAFLEIYVTLFLSTLAAIMIGLLISAIVPNMNTVMYLAFVVLMFQMTFSGVLFDLPGVSKQISVITLTRWSMEALGASVDVEGINRLTQSRFQPDPVEEEVAVDVERPSEEWQPVTVLTRTEEIEVPVQPGLTQSVAISVPEVIENEMITVTETLTESVRLELDPVDLNQESELELSYARTTEHLLTTWSILAGSGLVYGLITAFVLRRKDVI
ncbi:MAG: FHA domain-containing protein [Anaerolineae bacterium]